MYELNYLYKRIVVERFKSYAKILGKAQYDFVYLFDLGDIVFQKNPNEWVERNLGDKKIIAGSECIKYKDEKWAVKDFKQSFGYFFEFIKNKPTYNAGSFAGYTERIRDISMNIYSLCNEHKCSAPDQSAFNLLIQTAYKNETFYCSLNDEWCCQCGTTLDPTKMNAAPFNYSKYLLERPPVIENMEVKNSEGKKFYIVHQYNRVPELNSYYNTIFE